MSRLGGTVDGGYLGTPVAFSLFNTAHVACRPHARVGACWIDQQAAKLTPSK
jgi:hypothetical protein